MPTQDIGTFNKRVLLTGAGLSRNWGGMLASEMWHTIVGHRAVRDDATLTNLLKSHVNNFEEAIGIAMHDTYYAASRDKIIEATKDAFDRLNDEITRPPNMNGHHQVNEYMFNRFISRFAGFRDEGNDTGYIFTLNQDILIERKYIQNVLHQVIPPCLPGIRFPPNTRPFDSNFGTPFMTGMGEIVFGPSETPSLRGHLNYIKLHGSTKWLASDRSEPFVIGTNKTEQISGSGILTWYFNLFREILLSGEVILVTCGYGFRDDHVNAVIKNAVENAGLKLFVWNSHHNHKELVGNDLWQGYLGGSARPMTEIFPPDQSRTEEGRRIFVEVFGDERGLR